MTVTDLKRRFPEVFENEHVFAEMFNVFKYAAVEAEKKSIRDFAICGSTPRHIELISAKEAE